MRNWIFVGNELGEIFGFILEFSRDTKCMLFFN